MGVDVIDWLKLGFLVIDLPGVEPILSGTRTTGALGKGYILTFEFLFKCKMIK